MGSLIHRFQRWLADEEVVHECRNCGTTLDEERAACPTCGSTDITRYDLE